jgi:phosphatidylserine/phosphatidylglycerophosphate/cardiolipin synthase-like enzyme
MATYLRYREATYSTATDGSDTRQYPPELEAIARRIFARAGGGAGYAIVGSQNQDYRGMFMDGEIGLVFGGAQAIVPLLDLVFMEGITTWVADQATLDRLIPPVGEMKRRLARVTKDAV